jgi:hypothetical protein|tara:strand:+ start:782 stop:1042 length:261 start_codon:yes stop_codon:yes gene_type:complete
MNNIEDYLLRLLLECLTAQEYEIKRLDKKLDKIQELILMNNDLLGFLAKNSMPADQMILNTEIPLNQELWEELIKYSAELEKWGKA